MADDEDFRRGDKVDQYKLLEPLGKGGMATVWKVEDTMASDAAEEIKAIKFLTGEERRESFDRFHEEARALIKFDHPSVVRFDRYVVSRDFDPYLVMEHLEGKSLQDWIAAARIHREDPQGPLLKPSLCLSMMRQSADGLAYVHEQKTAHRDIKPGNLLLDRTFDPQKPDREPKVKLADFGVAILGAGPRGKLTSTGAFVGTFLYAAPEYLQRLEAYHRRVATGQASWEPPPLEEFQKGDVFALGMVFYELYTGSQFFTPNSNRQGSDVITELLTSRMGLGTSIQALSQHPHPSLEAAPGVWRLLRDMLEVDPKKRLSANQVKTRVTDLIAERSMELEPITQGGRKKTGKRPGTQGRAPLPARLIAAALGGVLLVSLVVVGTQYLNRPPVAQQVSTLTATALEPSKSAENVSDKASGKASEKNLVKTSDQNVTGSPESAAESTAPTAPTSSPKSTRADAANAQQDTELTDLMSKVMCPMVRPRAGKFGKNKEGAFFISLNQRSDSGTRHPLPGTIVKVFNDTRHADEANTTSCLQIKHTEHLWSLFCGVNGHRNESVKEGQPVSGPARGGGDHITWRLYQADSPEAADRGDKARSHSVDLALYLKSGCVR